MQRGLLCLALCWLFLLPAGVSGQEQQFPYDSELILDTTPMRGSRKIPNMDVSANGSIILEMWCNRLEGQFVVAADTVTVLTGPSTQRQCPPERLEGDERLLAALTQVTNWRRNGDILDLLGPPRPLRFRLPTN